MKTYSFTVTFSKEELEKFLEYGGASYEDLVIEQLEEIFEAMASGVKDQFVDDPHYVYEDYIEGIL